MGINTKDRFAYVLDNIETNKLNGEGLKALLGVSWIKLQAIYVGLDGLIKIIISLLRDN